MTSLTVLYTQQDRHKPYGEWLNLVVIKPFVRHEAVTEDFYLYTGDSGIELWKQGDKRGVWIDERSVVARASFTSDLAKACGLTKGQKPQVFDGMTGFGVDAATLALLGARVDCVEQLPGITLMAKDLFCRCGLNGVPLRCEDSWRQLENITTDVVYLDPMFEMTGRTALAGKRLQYLEPLAGNSEHTVSDWVTRAIPVSRNRVVVKRHLRDATTVQPDWQIVGKRVRFDVYKGGLVS